MFQNMVISLTPLQNVDEINCLENRPFAGIWPEFRQDKYTEIKKTIMKKPKRVRTAYTTEQLRALEMLYTRHKYITSERRQVISKALNIGDKSIKIWFQNRRMKEKRETSESSSDSSNEAVVCEMSPPQIEPTLPAQSSSSNETIHDTNSDLKHLVSPEPCQSQVPPCFCNVSENVQTSLASDNNIIQSNGMQFYTDSNVYPTQYYPSSDNYYNGYNYNYYQYQQNAMYEYNNYWALNNGESNYLYN